MNKYFQLILPIITLLLGFGFGHLDSADDVTASVIPLKEFREISLVQLKSIEGDSLQATISGPARILWNKEMIEGDGEYQIPLGTIETPDDRLYTEFFYTGNAKTGKFYPSSSYPARGVEHIYRRFFDTKEAALKAGFIASKLVK